MLNNFAVDFDKKFHFFKSCFEKLEIICFITTLFFCTEGIIEIFSRQLFSRKVLKH